MTSHPTKMTMIIHLSYTYRYHIDVIQCCPSLTVVLSTWPSSRLLAESTGDPMSGRSSLIAEGLCFRVTTSACVCDTVIGVQDGICLKCSQLLPSMSSDLVAWYKSSPYMITSSNGNIFRVTGPLCGEFTGHRWIPRTRASDAELWRFLWSASEKTID